jgi:hypothetical protein
MHAFEPPPPPPKRHTALGIWALLAVVFLLPSLLVWVVRATALALACTPGPGLCHGIALGGGLRDTLNLAWLTGTNAGFLVLLGIAAAIAALFARRPLVAALSALVLPISALVLPTLAVFASSYNGCAVNEGGVGDCTLWGAQMGMSFHTAAMAPWLLYDIVPYAFAAAIMLGLIGWMFCREKAA